MFLSFKKGELIVLIKDDEFSQQRGWMKGQNDRTRKTGAVPVDAIFILPTLSKPTNELLVSRVLQQLSDGWTGLTCGALVCFRICSTCLRTRGKTSLRQTRRKWEPWIESLLPR